MINKTEIEYSIRGQSLVKAEKEVHTNTVQLSSEKDFSEYRSPEFKQIGQLSHLIMGNSGPNPDFATPTQV